MRKTHLALEQLVHAGTLLALLALLLPLLALLVRRAADLCLLPAARPAARRRARQHRLLRLAGAVVVAALLVLLHRLRHILPALFACRAVVGLPQCRLLAGLRGCLLLGGGRERLRVAGAWRLVRAQELVLSCSGAALIGVGVVRRGLVALGACSSDTAQGRGWGEAHQQERGRGV